VKASEPVRAGAGGKENDGFVVGVVGVVSEFSISINKGMDIFDSIYREARTRAREVSNRV
jgi:hypothetical protein